MEHQAIENHEEMEDEEFPEEFQCYECLDIMYKPVALACGHIFCFWCVFKAMNTFHVSNCRVCHNPYYHFPRICELFHFLLLKLYPMAYKRRERQVAEEEKKIGNKYPQFDLNVIDSQLSKVIDDQNISCPIFGEVSVGSNATTCGGDHSLIQDSPQITSHVDNISIPSSSSQTTSKKAEAEVRHTNKVLATDLQCVVCKELLCRPVVLNCGHVFCEACIHEYDNVCKCPLCQSAHPKGFPSVCLVLEHFLEEHFAEEYTARKISSLHFQSTNPSRKNQEQGAQPSFFSRNGIKCHPGVGCDYCGMCPIIGLRFKCKDCVEKIGFDLCEGCYNSSSKRPGRFNQQHTIEHQFEVVRAEYDYGNGGISDNEIRICYLMNDDSDDEMSAPHESPSEEPRELENATVPPDSSNEHSDDVADQSAS
ncbi:hypothetical protein ACS0TY_023508 [Phlomoides rotata]